MSGNILTIFSSDTFPNPVDAESERFFIFIDVFQR